MAPPIQPPVDKLLRLKDRFGSIWELPFNRILWFDHAPDRDRTTLLEIAGSSTDFLRIHFRDDKGTCDIMSNLTGEVLAYTNTNDLLDLF